MKAKHPIKGSTLECLRHLDGTITDCEDYYDRRDMIASFTGVLDSTVRRWVKEGKAPYGDSLVRLRFYLELLGYEVTELTALHPDVRDLARLFAFRVVSLDEIIDAIPSDAERENMGESLIGMFRGNRGASDERLRLFAKLSATHGAKLAKVRADTSKAVVFKTAPSPVEALSNLKEQLTSAKGDAATIEAISLLIKAMLPLAEVALADGFSADSREVIRQKAGQENISRLSNLLTQLCGESVRTALHK